MTKLLILSDSHGQMRHMRAALSRFRPDAVIHLGDHVADADALALDAGNIPVLSVRGNCDYMNMNRPEMLECTFEGVKLFAVHGHRYGVKSGLLRLRYAAMEQEAQIVLFGHTHQAHCEALDGLWLFNPGACSGYIPTCGLIEIEKGSIRCRIIDLYSEETV